MKHNSENDSKASAVQQVRRTDAGRAFTLIELLAILAVLALLSCVLLPALAGAKMDVWRGQCASNLRQLGIGFRLFEVDHNEMFPAAAYYSSNAPPRSGHLAWDSYLHRYIGGNGSDSNLLVGAWPVELTPKCEACPADVQPKVWWIGNPPFNGIRSFAMVGVGPAWGTEYQVSSGSQQYRLPALHRGVGIYWADGGLPGTGLPDWDAKSYKTSVVKDAGGTILMVEEPNGQGAAGNIWPSISCAPLGIGSLVQIDPDDGPPDPSAGVGVNLGKYTYQAHDKRFNYLFHDGHVAALRIEQTVGTGTRNAPGGMWTVAPDD